MSRRVAHRLVVAVAFAAPLGAVAARGAPVGVTSAHLTPRTLPPPAAYPTSLSLTDGGKVVGRVEKADVVTVTYLPLLSPASFCSTWVPGVASQRIGSLTVVVEDGTGAGGDDVLTATATSSTKDCGGVFAFGRVDLGSGGYVAGGDVTFPGSTATLTEGGGTTTLEIDLGNPPKKGGGTAGTVTAGAAAVYTPAAGLVDGSGAAAAAGTAVSTTTVQF